MSVSLSVCTASFYPHWNPGTNLRSASVGWRERNMEMMDCRMEKEIDDVNGKAVGGVTGAADQ